MNKKIKKELSKLSADILKDANILIYDEKMRSSKELESLTKFCIKYPDLRFWQAVINWANFNISKVEVNGKKITYKDLFYE